MIMTNFSIVYVFSQVWIRLFTLLILFKSIVSMRNHCNGEKLYILWFEPLLFAENITNIWDMGLVLLMQVVDQWSLLVRMVGVSPETSCVTRWTTVVITVMKLELVVCNIFVLFATRGCLCMPCNYNTKHHLNLLTFCPPWL